MPKKQKESIDSTVVKKSNASVVVGCHQILRLNAVVKPCVKGLWGIDVFYGENNAKVKRIDGWYNMLFESGFDADQALVIEFRLDEEACKHWRFYGKGVEFFGAGCNCQYSLIANLLCSDTEGEMILDNTDPTFGFELKRLPKKSRKLILSQTPEFLPVKMSFVAEYTNGNSKKNGVYMSQDPLIGVGKPKKT